MRGRIEVLGPLRFDHPEHGARPRIDRRLELLTVLACSDGVVGRHTLGSLFWTDSPRAQANLRQLASRLRAWRLPALRILPGGLAWDGSSDACDFRLALAEERWADAWSLYRGDLLEGHPGDVSPEFAEWLERERRAYREQAYAAGMAVASALETHDPAEAARVFRRLLELDPYGEDALDAFLRVAPRIGIVDVAIDVSRRFEDRLRSDLGIELRIDVKERVLALREPTAATTTEGARLPGAELPNPATPCVGRQREFESAMEVLASGRVRLLTLVGPGGIGKTRLALEIARARWPALSGRGAYVALERAESTSDMVTAVATAIGVTRLGDADASAHVVRTLRDREFLLVLDNLEQLVESAPVLGEWLERCPGLQVLATSRRPLGSPWERVMALQGLSCPEDPDDPSFEEFDGAAVFLHHARRRNPGYALRRTDRRALVDVLERVGGVPLAIELAAGWTPSLPLPAIADEVRRDLDALGARAAGADDRHRSVRAVFDGSWSFLLPAERRALACASVFRGGFTANAFLEVAQARPEVLAVLVDASLVQRRGERYDLHDLVRQYAAERLSEDPELLERARSRHAARFAKAMNALSDDIQGGPRQIEAVAEVSEEMPNLRAAWGDAVERRDERAIAALIEPLWWFLEIRGLYREGLDLFGDAENAVDEPEVRALLLARRGAFAHRAWHVDLCRQLSERSLRASEEAGIPPDWTAVINLAILPWIRGDLHASWDAHERAVALADRVGDTRLAGAAQEHLASIAGLLGRLEDAERRHGAALRWARVHGDRWAIALTLCNLGMMYAGAARTDEARGVLAEALELARQIGFTMIVGAAAATLAELTRSEGRLDRSIALYEEAVAAYRRIPSAEGEEIDALLGLGAALAAQSRAEEAERALQGAADAAVAAEDAEREAAAWEALARLDVSAGARDRAYVALAHLEGLDAERASALRASLARPGAGAVREGGGASRDGGASDAPS